MTFVYWVIFQWNFPFRTLWGRILGQNPVKRVFLLAIHSHLYTFVLRFPFLETHATSSLTVQLLYTEKDKGGKPDRKPYALLPYGLRNPYRNLQFLRTLKIMPRNLNEIVRSWIRLHYGQSTLLHSILLCTRLCVHERMKMIWLMCHNPHRFPQQPGIVWISTTIYCIQ